MQNQALENKMNKLFTLTLFTAMAIMGIAEAKAAWTVVYNPYTKQTTVVYVPDNQPCPNYYNPYQPYQPYNPYYRPQPTYQFNFNKHDNHGHGGKNHGGGGHGDHGKKHCK